MCDASVVVGVGYDRRRSELCNAPLNMEYGNNTTEKLSSKHNP